MVTEMLYLGCSNDYATVHLSKGMELNSFIRVDFIVYILPQ